MECPFGHRFFLIGPDRVMDGPMQSSQVRRAIQGLLTRDIPIFLPCHCLHHQSAETNQVNLHSGTNSTGEWGAKTGGGGGQMEDDGDQTIIWAQLTRIYLALPSSPLQVCIQPCVRPGPSKSTPTFHIGPTIDQFCDERLASCFESNEFYALGSDEELYALDKESKTKTTVVSEQLTGSKNQKPGFVLLDNGFLWVIRLPYPLILKIQIGIII